MATELGSTQISTLLETLPGIANVLRSPVADALVNVIRAAAYAQFEATGNFPADGPSGVVPAGMAPFLPKDFSFHKRDYDADWESWAVSDSTGGVTGTLVAVTFVVPDEKLGLTVLYVLGGNCTHWSAGNAHTFVVQNTLESPQ